MDKVLSAETCQHVGGASALAALLISVVHISRHLRYNTSKEIKQCTLRILLLVPFYSLDCFLSLMLSGDHQAWPYLLTAFREFYEAVVLSAFMQLVLTFLGRRKDGSMGGPQAVGDSFCSAMRKPSHASISSRLEFVPVVYPPGAGFVSGVLIGILQYALVMVVVLSVQVSIWVSWGSEVNELCARSGALCLYKVPFYAKGVSCGWAMYNLTFFYFEAKMCKDLRERLEMIHPHNKFFSVKMIIFFTFFQKLLVGIVLKDWFHVFDVFSGNPESVAESFQAFLLCLEMLLFAVWHMQAYPVDEFNKLDAAASLQAAISKQSMVDLKNSVQEALDAGLGTKPDPEDKLALAWHELFQQARALLDRLYPEVHFEGESPEFILKTTSPGTTRIVVDMKTRRLCVTSFSKEEASAEDGDEAQVTLTEVDSGVKRRETRFQQQKKTRSMGEDVAVLVHNLCSPSGEVGFLSTCAMYKDILALKRSAQEQRRAVRFLRQVEHGDKKHTSDREVARVFRAFDREGRDSVTREDFLNVFIAASPSGDGSEAQSILDSIGVSEAHNLDSRTFESYIRKAASASNLNAIAGRKLEEPLLPS